MKVTFNCNSGANVNSNRTETWDLSTQKGQEKFGYSIKDWTSMSAEEKWEICNEWAQERLDISFDEQPTPKGDHE